MKSFRLLIVIVFALGLASIAVQTMGDTASATTSTLPTSLTQEELQAQIKSRAADLDKLNQQIESTSQTLKQTQTQRVTLQRELTIMQNTSKQLELNIQADTINVQKLSLELDSLNYDIRDIESSMSTKREAIAKILSELQKNDEENPLMVFLKSNSLADSILESQTLINLKSQLVVDITNLQSLHDTYMAKVTEANDKRDEVTFHQKNLQNRQLILQDQKVEQNTLLSQTKDKESVYQKQVADLKKQQQAIAAEIDALDSVLRQKINPSLLPTPHHGVLAVPTVNGMDNITQGYGATSFAQTASYVTPWHNGVDFGGDVGDPIYAAEDGIVVATGNQDAYCYHGAYGRFIVINHTNNLTTLYGHLSRQIVQKGDTVKRGQLIGYMGRTGYATGPHLHLTVYAQATYYLGTSKTCGPMPHGGDLDPMLYL